jgi:hypothetical protein
MALTMICRTHPSTFKKEISLCPDLSIAHLKKHQAVIWIVAHTAYYVITRQNILTLEDYVDFFKRTRWKTHKKTGGKSVFGNCLSVTTG